MMNGNYTVRTGVVTGNRKLYLDNKLVAEFKDSFGGRTALAMVSNAIARNGGTLFDETANRWIVGTLDQLVSE